jgi:hypothetical protein
MSDYCIYWKNFAADCESYGYGEENPLFDWRTNATKIYESLLVGDWFWFLTSGDKCDMPRKTAAYLVSIFQVDRREFNQDDDPPYSSIGFRYTIWADKSRRMWVAPPLLVDEIVRPGGHSEKVHIGNLLQGPRGLSEEAATRLKGKIQRERQEVFARLFGVKPVKKR